MSTVDKGNAFELKILRLFEDLIKNGGYPIPPQSFCIFNKKKYWSPIRQSNIETDISIEVTRKGASTYCQLVVIECKDYKSPISVEKLEAFFQRLTQIGAHKGIFVATSSYQESARKFAESHGIGLIRYFEDASSEWVLERTVSGLISAENSKAHRLLAQDAIVSESTSNCLFDCCSYISGRFTVSLTEVVNELFDSDLKTRLIEEYGPLDKPRQYIPYLHEAEIEKSSLELLSKIKYKSGYINLGELSLILQDEIGLKVKIEEVNAVAGRLGSISFDPLLITLYPEPKMPQSRLRFTWAHELGHLWLGHGNLLKSEFMNNGRAEDEEPGANTSSLLVPEIRRMEFQANYFASTLLLPKECLFERLTHYAELYGIRRTKSYYLFLDHQDCNRSDVGNVIGALSDYFHVSLSAIKIRLKKLGLLIIEDKPADVYREKSDDYHRRKAYWDKI